AWGCYLIAAAAHQLITEAAMSHICTACSSSSSSSNCTEQQAAAPAAAATLGFASAAEVRSKGLELLGLAADGQPRLLQQLLQQEAVLQRQNLECSCCCSCCCLCSITAALKARCSILTLLLQFLQQQRLLQLMPADLRQDALNLLDELRLQLLALLPPLRACTQRSRELQRGEQQRLQQQQQQQRRQQQSSGSSSKGSVDAVLGTAALCCSASTQQQLELRRLWRCALLLQLQHMLEDQHNASSSSSSNGSNSNSTWESLLQLPFAQVAAAVLQQPRGTLELVECLRRAATLLRQQQQQQQQQEILMLFQQPENGSKDITECSAWLQVFDCLLDSVMALLLPRLSSSSSSSRDWTDTKDFVRLLLRSADEYALDGKLPREDGSDFLEYRAAALCCAACDGVVAVLQRQLAAAAASAALPAFPLLQRQTLEALGQGQFERRRERLQLECLYAAFRCCEGVLRLCELLRPSEAPLRLLAARQQQEQQQEFGVAAADSAAAAAGAADAGGGEGGALLTPAQQKAMQRLLLLQQDTQARVLCRARIVEDTAAAVRCCGGPKVS
ncbi:hypothetical protein ETH_00003005, partial [Eimeria tenella]